MDILSKKVLVLDGGLGTTLEDEHAVKFSSQTPLWSSHMLVENTPILRTVQENFVQAGADIVLTATYQTSFHGFANTKITQPDGIAKDEAKRLMLSAVTIARQAFRGQSGLVALSLGAYGAIMVPSTEYSGEYGSMTDVDLYNFHRERLDVFVESEQWKEVNVVAFETLPRIDEVSAVRRVMQHVRDKVYWISCVFPNEDERLPDGTEIEELVRIMLQGEQPPFAIGINCTKIHKIANLVRSFENSARSQGLRLPSLVLYPDGAGGKVYDTKLQQWIGHDREQPPWNEQVADIVREALGRGAWQGIIVGGCCKTKPEHIGKLRESLVKIEHRL